MRKVMVTGIGMLCACGNGKAAAWPAIKAGKRFSICEPKLRTAKKPEAPSIRRASGFLIICAWNGLPGLPHRAPPALP